jgi:hypothetical protein
LNQNNNKIKIQPKDRQNNQPKTPNQNGHIKINLPKMAFWLNWTWEQKNHMGIF